MDNRLIQGLLIASCVLLLFGVILTGAEIAGYRGAPATPVARRAAPAGEPMEVPAETPEAEAEAQPVEEAEAPEAPAAGGE